MARPKRSLGWSKEKIQRADRDARAARRQKYSKGLKDPVAKRVKSIHYVMRVCGGTSGKLRAKVNRMSKTRKHRRRAAKKEGHYSACGWNKFKDPSTGQTHRLPRLIKKKYPKHN